MNPDDIGYGEFMREMMFADNVSGPDLFGTENRRKILGPKNNDIITAFLGDGPRSVEAYSTNPYYGELLAWTTKCLTAAPVWNTESVHGHRDEKPIFWDIQTDYTKSESCLINGQMLIEKEGIKLVVTVVASRGFVQVEAADEASEQVKKLVRDIGDFLKDHNFYRGKKVSFNGKISFLKAGQRDWDSVILDPVLKKEIQLNTVGFLKNCSRWERYGVPPKRGIILAGDPGVGKTIICKALMSEADKISCICTAAYGTFSEGYISDLYSLAQDLSPSSIDFAGAVLIAVGLIPLLLAFVWAGSQYAWGSWEIIGLLCFAAATLFIFALVERRVREPILSLNLFKNKVFSVSVIATFLTTMGMFGAILYVTVFAQGVVGISATNSGLVLMPMMIGLIIASTIAGLIISRTGKYKIMTVIGVIVSVVGMFLFSRIDTATTQLGLIVRMVILGVGLGITMPVFTITVQSAFGPEKLGEVTAGSQLFRGIGGTVGTAILGGIMNSQLASRLADIQNDPFVASMNKLNPNSAIGNINGNTVQGLLSTAGQEQIKSALAQVPQPMQSQLVSSFNHFLDSIKVAFSSSLDHVFLIGTIIMGLALVAVFFLPEIKLRKTNQKAITEAGMELEAELAQSDADDEPEL